MGWPAFCYILQISMNATWVLMTAPILQTAKTWWEVLCVNVWKAMQAMGKLAAVCKATSMSIGILCGAGFSRFLISNINVIMTVMQ